MSHVFLVGFMGAGKSTVACLVADQLGRPCVDIDRLVESEEGCTIAQIFSEQGEAVFRRLESDALKSLADAPPSVVACGGGVVTVAENRALLKVLGRVVYLDVTADEMLARVGEDSRRPLLASGDARSSAELLLDARESLYTAVADVTVDTVGRTPRAVAAEVTDYLRSEDAS